MSRRGFTLIELLIVIALIAILAGAMVPMFADNKTKAEQAKAQAELDSIKTAAIMLYADTSQWPCGDCGSGDPCPLGNGVYNNTDCGGSAISGWAGPYMDQWKEDPWFHNYNITLSGSTLRAQTLGKDNAAGGTGANEDISVIITNSAP